MTSTFKSKATMAQILAERGELQPDEKAYTYLADGERESGSFTFGELHRRVACIARELAARRLRGERALLLYPSELEFIPAFLACLDAGVIAVPCPYPARERSWPRVLSIAQDCRPAIVLTSEEGLNRVGARLQAADWPASREVAATDSMEDSGAALVLQQDAVRIAFLQYTSGSTADPRGVIVTHEALMHNEAMIQEVFSQTSADVIAAWLPLFHDMGLIGTVLQPLYVGSRCILMPAAAFLQRPARWLEAVSRYRATTSGGPDFAWDLCTKRVSNEDLFRLDLSSWRTAFSGAEPVRMQTLQAFARRFAAAGFSRNAFQPCYGLAEATLLVSAGLHSQGPTSARFDRAAMEAGRVVLADPESASPTELVSCGRSCKGQQLRIVDPTTGAVLRPGLVGEIEVSGESIADGYWNNPVQTAEVFVTVGDRVWLRTGDLGFLLSGELFITGRWKDLIILRGRNIYPQDLEAVSTSAHESVQSGAAAAFAVACENGEGVVLLQELKRSAVGSREEIAAAIREAMVREQEVDLHEVILLAPGKLPRTSSGKVRRRFCRSQYLAGVWQSAVVGPAASVAIAEVYSGWLQETIEVVASVLRMPPASIHRDLTLAGAGLDSLRAIELAWRIEDTWRVRLTAAELLEGMTVEELAQRVSAGRVDPTPPPEAKASLNLTPGQKTLLTLDALARGASPNNLYAACWIEGPVDVEALFKAAGLVVQRHAALRSTLAGPAEDTLVERPGLGADCAMWKLDGLDNSGLRRAAAMEGSRAFDLVHGPLLRLRIGACQDGRHVLLIAFHHLVGDLRSLEIILHDLGVLHAESTGQASALLPDAAPFSEFTGHQLAWLAGEQAEQARSFWRQELAELPLLELPHDHPRRGVPSLQGDIVRGELSAEFSRVAHTLARENNSTMHVLLLSVFQAFLHRYTGALDIVVGSPFLGRNKSRFANTVGYFTNPLPLRISLRDDPVFRELFSRNSACVRRVMQHADYPGALLAQEFGRRSDIGSSLYHAYFVFEQAGPGHPDLPAVAIGVPGVSIKVGPLQLTSIGADQNTSQFDLLLYAAEHNGGLHLALNYDTDRFERRTAEDILSSFISLLVRAVEHPEEHVGELDILNVHQRNEQLHVWNQAGRPSSVMGCIHERFEEVALRNPHAVAVVDGVDELPYGELLERSRALSEALREQGIGAESRVPLLLAPGANQIVAILAVLQAGAAYVPLDIQHPAERLAYVVKDALDGSDAAVLITDQSMREIVGRVRCASGIEFLVVDVERPPHSRKKTAVTVLPENAAYVIYTSGSTGKPKGVVNTHANVLRLFAATEEQFQFTARDTWTMYHSYAFDFSVWEIWGALLYGGRLVIVPHETRRSPRQFYHLLRSESVTVLCQTPSAFRQLSEVAEPWGARHRIALRTVIFGGEALDLGSLAAWLQCYDGAPPRMVNMYGITETTVHVTYRLLQNAEIGSSHRSLIGRPIGDLQIYLLDSRLNLLPAGAVGEIFVGGPGLARGYHRRPRLTAERFVPNPFSGLPGDRLYRSGDLARYLPGGELEYLGRADHQVKIRGHRIELGEIQHALSKHPQLSSALVVAAPDRHGETRLIAYTCGQIPKQTLGAELHEFLASNLPSYMIPSAFVPVERFVLTANGKIDRTALPQTEMETHVPGQSQGFLTATESALGLIWAEVLGGPVPAQDDDFFALGGHSLLVMRTVKRVREVFGVDLPVAQVFASPSLAKMAADIDSRRGLPVLPPIEPALERATFPLSFAQERVWLAESLLPATSLMNIPIALELGGELDTRLLQRSFQQIVDRHEILRTAFVQMPSGPVQKVLRELHVVMEQTAAASAQEFALLSQVEGQLPFELHRPPLFRLLLVRLSPARNVLLLTVHHIVFDLWSAGILLREVMQAYAALSQGLPDPLPPLSVQYGDFARWERSASVLNRMTKQVDFWRRELAGVDPNFTAPLDRPRPESPSMRGGLRRRRLEDELCASLQELRLRRGVTLYVLLLAAFKVLLRRISKTDDILVGTDVAVREIDSVQPMIGMFVNQVPLRTHVDLDMTFDQVLTRVRNTTTRAWANRNLAAQHIGRPPLFRVLFDLQDFNLPAVPNAPLRVRRLETAWAMAKHDLSLFMEEEDKSLTATLEYNADVLNGHSSETMLSQYVRLLEQIAGEPHLRIRDYALMEEPVEQGLAAMFNEDMERL